MNDKDILSMVDYTLLSPTASLSKYKQFCEEAKEKGITHVVVPPIYVNQLKEMNRSLVFSTILDYPYGFSKLGDAISTMKSIKADEFAVVVNYNNIISNKWIATEESLSGIRAATSKPLKVFINTDYLNRKQLKDFAKLLKKYDIDYAELYNDKIVTMQDIDMFKDYVKVKVTDSRYNRNDIEELAYAGVRRFGLTDISEITDDTKIYVRKEKNEKEEKNYF